MKRLKDTIHALMMLAFLAGLIGYAPVEAAQKNDEKPNYAISDLTVTSQKRTENIQEIPMSITSLTGEDLTDSGAVDLWDVTRMSPNVYLSNNAIENIIVIRGIAPFNMSLYPACGVYVDDIPMPLQHQHNPDLYDIKRVEILRGPQGTLYGRNSESGVINIVTRQPGNKFSGNLVGEIGFYDTGHGDIPTYRGQVNLNAPIIKDKFAFRIAGQWHASNGFMENRFNGTDDAARYDNKNIRGIFRWTPNENWDVSAILDGEKGDNGDGQYRYIKGSLKTPRHIINYNDSDGYWDREGSGQALRVKYDGFSFNFTSITGRRSFDTKYYQDLDLGPFPFGYSDMDYSTDSLNQEFRLASKEDSGPLKWLGGVFIFNEDSDADVNFAAYMQEHKADWTNEGAAMFGQLTYTLFEKLHLTGGLRLDYTKGSGNKTYTLMGRSNSFSQDFDNTELLPKVAVSYDATENIMPYASIGRGYLSGGFAYATAQNKQSFVYDPEYSMNYEMGIKTKWFDNRLTANLALFRVNMTDRQIYQQVPGAAAIVRVVENAGEAHSQGVEFELCAKPAQGLEFSAGFGLIQAEVDEWKKKQANPLTGQTQLVDLSGKKLPNVPSYTFNIGAMYRHSTGFFGRVDLNGIGEIFNDAENTKNLKADAYELVNLALGYETELFTFTLWSKNLFDQEYYNRLNSWVGGGVIGIDGEPRSVGLTVTYRF